jgi:hypothetical protein
MESINVSIVVLKTGTQIICELKEVFDGDENNRKGICLLMIHPYELSLVASGETETQQDLQVKFSKWCPYSIDHQFKIPYDTVMAIGVADTNLEQAYKVKVDSLIQSINQNAQLEQKEIDNVINPEVMSNE